MKDKTQSRYVQGKFVNGETAFMEKDKGVFQQVEIVRLVQARFMSDNTCVVSYTVKDVMGRTVNEDISETRLVTADEMVIHIKQYAEYEWLAKDLKE